MEAGAIPTEPEQTPEAPEAPEPQAEEPASDPNDPWAALNARLDQFEERLPEQQESQEVPDYVDLIDQLMPEYDEEPEQAQVEPASEAPQDDAAQLQAWLDQQVNARVQQALQPVLAEQEWDRRRGELNQFAEKHPEVRDPQMVDRIQHRLLSRAQRYGEGVLTDPDAIKDAYFAIKAEAVASTQTPAEAVERGATLETNAGPSGGESDESVQEQITRRLIGNEGAQEGVPFL